MYLDSAYIAKYYLPEPDAKRVRAVIQSADSLISSAIAMSEMACLLHRQMREGYLNKAEMRRVLEAFLDHCSSGLWTLIPVSENLLREATFLVSGLPGNISLRAGDAIHLTTARNVGASEIWASDRHLVGAAPYFGLAARTA
jgi:predicted nucleic acid-binding protein